MGVVAAVLSGQAPVVQVVVEAGTVPPGRQLRVTGHAADRSWPVRAGQRVSDGGQVVLGDALAPVNTPIVYRVTSLGELMAASAPVTRPWAGRSLLSDTVGGHRVDLLWQGDDERDVPQRVTLHEIPGRATPVAVMDPVMGAGTVALTARTDAAGTRAMAALAAEARVVALFHNPRWCHQCRRGACDVPLVTVVVLTSVTHRRSARVDEAERTWTLKGTLVGVPQPGTPIWMSTWDDFDAVGLDWDRADAMALDWDRADRTIWQEVGG